MSLQRVLAGPKRQRFFGHLRATEVLPNHHLIRIVKSSDLYSPAMRSAALRHLISRAPIEVTQGRPFAERRRLTKIHYKVQTQTETFPYVPQPTLVHNMEQEQEQASA